MIISSVFKDYFLDFIDSSKKISELGNNEDIYFVIDRKVYSLYKEVFFNIKDERLSLIDAIESNKNINTVLLICEKILQMNSRRNTVLVSIGGGIIQDITGLIANILYRGIKWVYIPTTLLAMCDSCIGGKSSLNFINYKNILGSFYPPDRILIYFNFLNTLSSADYNSGLGEVVKFNIMIGEMGFLNLQKKMDSLLTRNHDNLYAVVLNSLEFKKAIIEKDEFDKGKRIYLNFGHTFGHALESTSSYQIPHGTAVILGMIIANNISFQRNIINKTIVQSIENLCKNILPPPINLKKEWFEHNKIIDAVKKDKKQTNSSIKAILLNKDFSLNMCNDITEGEIESAIKHLLRELNIN